MNDIFWGSVSFEKEVAESLSGLTEKDYARVWFYLDLLAARGPLLSQPHTKQLAGKLRELRFHLGTEAMRLTYWIAPGRNIIMLTVFRKTRQRDAAQVMRARRALWMCQESHVHQSEREI